MKQEQLNNGWFSVEKKLPPLNEYYYRNSNSAISICVLLFDKTAEQVYVGYFDFRDGSWVLMTDSTCDTAIDTTEITYWRFIPKLPNTED